MASKLFDTSKIVSGIKSGKTKRKEPPKYIYVSNQRGRKVKKINPRWTAWNKNKNKRDIDKQVDTYVKKNQKGQKINKDLTKDFSKRKESGVGPIREGKNYEKNIKKSKEKVTSKEKYVDPDAADKTAEKVFRGSSSVEQAKEKHAKAEKLKIGHRRTKGEGIDRKGGDGYRGDTRITARLKKAGFTESRLAKLRADHAKWKADRKKKKKKS